jgi:hypothetical protein
MRKMNWGPSLEAILLITIIVLGLKTSAGKPSTTTGFELSPSTYTSTGGGATGNFPTFSIDIVSPEGTSKTLTNADLQNFTWVEGVGGRLRNWQWVEGYGLYRGFDLGEILTRYGGLTPGDSIRVIARDNYTRIYTWGNIQGSFYAFDNVTHQETSTDRRLVLILAFNQDKQPMKDGEGPIRLAIISGDGLLTEANLWVKMVERIEVIRGNP